MRIYILFIIENRKGTKRKNNDQTENSNADPTYSSMEADPTSSYMEANPSLPTDSDLLQTGEVPSEVLQDDQLRDELLERAAQSSVKIKRVGLATVKMYIPAVVDLHNDQALADSHSHRPHPHGQLVDALLQTLKYQEQKHKRENYVNRGVGTVADGYSTTAEMERLVEHYFLKNSQEGLRNGVAFLLQHYGLLRGESVRMMEFPDLQCMLLENEGISPCYALMYGTQARQNESIRAFGIHGLFAQQKNHHLSPNDAFLLSDTFAKGGVENIGRLHKGCWTVLFGSFYCRSTGRAMQKGVPPGGLLAGKD